MTLLSYISIPYTSSSNETSYLRIDLTTNKVFIKENEVFNFDELKDDVTEDDHDSDCLDCDHKNDLIELIKVELENETKKDDNEDYVKELKETLEKMQM